MQYYSTNWLFNVYGHFICIFIQTVLVAVIPNSNVSTEQQPSSFFANFLQRCAPQMSMLCESEIQQRSAARIFTVRARHDLPVMKLSQQVASHKFNDDILHVLDALFLKGELDD